jgi:dipeptidyl aminopeptidase/acylaminoacyl peptidase
VSPLTFVRATVPPVLSVHGDADSAVPYGQSVRLHQALKSAGVVEELVTVPGAGHFPFTRAQYEKAFTAIEAFLTQRGIKAKH